MLRRPVRAALLVFAAGLAAACTTPPERPLPEAPARYAHAPAEDRPVDPGQLAGWWAAFGDPVLTALVEEAQVRNRDVQQAMRAVQAARAQLRGVVASQYPAIDLGADASRQRSRSERLEIGDGLLDLADFSGGSTRIDNWQSAVQASWEIDLFGATRARVSGAERQAEAAAAEAAAARLAVSANVAQAYVEIRALQARAQVLDEGVAIARKLEHIGQLRFETGEVTRLDVEAQAAERAELEAQAAELDMLIAEAALALDTLLAAPPGSTLARLAQPAPVPTADAGIPTGQPADLLRRRPDVVAEIARLRAAEHEALGARRDLFPTLALSAAFGRSGMQVQGLLSSISRFSQIGLMFAWPLLDFGRRQSAIDAADIQVEAGYLALEQTLADALEEVERALVQIHGHGRRAAAHEEALARREQAHRLALLTYEVGEADLAEVLDAQRGLLDGRQQMVGTRSALATAQIGLFTALGGGWR